MIDRGAGASSPRALGQHLGTHCYGQNGAGPRQLTSIVVAAPGGAACDGGASPVATFTYDDAGRQLTDGTSRMTYDGLDQMVAVDLPDGLRVEYAYGYDGQRIRTTDNRGAVPEHWFSPEFREVNGSVEQYIKAGDRILAKVDLSFFDETGDDPSPDLTATRTSGRQVGLAGLAGIGVLLGGVGAFFARKRRTWRPALAMLLVLSLLTPGCGSLFGSSDDTLWRATKITYFHTGFAAGPVLLTDENANIVDERRYEPFGQAIDSYREPNGNLFETIDYALEPFNVLNKPTDPRTGWSYHGARWMAPQTARWLTPDPVVRVPQSSSMSEPWALNPYQYAEQNPIVYWDPDGREGVPQPEQFRMVITGTTVAVTSTPVVVATATVAPAAGTAAAGIGLGAAAYLSLAFGTGGAATDGLGARRTPTWKCDACHEPEVQLGPSQTPAELVEATTDAVLDSVPDAAAEFAIPASTKPPHGNRKDSRRPSHVYTIYSVDSQGGMEVYKYGVSSLGVRVTDGKSRRAEAQVRRLNRDAQREDTGVVYGSSARDIEWLS